MGDLEFMGFGLIGDFGSGELVSWFIHAKLINY